MAKDEDAVQAPWGETDPKGITEGGAGSGAGGTTDTGGLDASGNELGASEPGGGGVTENEREDAAIRLAHESGRAT